MELFRCSKFIVGLKSCTFAERPCLPAGRPQFKLKNSMDTLIKEKVNLWLSGNFDPGTKEQLTKLQNENPSEVADAFYRNLEFGTGGLRGIMGVGTNRMNKYT